MIKATVTLSDGRKMFILGLSQRNMDLLKQDRPIQFHLEEIGGEGELLLFFGETEEKMREMLSDMIGPDTVVKGLPDH